MRTAAELAADHDGGRSRVTKRKYTGDTELGRKLLSLRRAHGLTLRDVERETGVSNPMLSQVEGGVVMPGVPTLARLIAFYGTTFEHLCGHMTEEA